MDHILAAAVTLSEDGVCSVEGCTYPGSTFFIDPEGMSTCQLFFAFLVYGYVLFVSADMIGDGAELLLLVPGYADMVGSMVLPILGAIPDGMMVLFSGIGPLEVAQENVAVGVGALAGSTIMLLTLPWILSVYAAQVDYDEATGECVGYKRPPGKRNSGTGVTACRFNEGVTKNAWLMFLTSLSYFVIQLPALMVDDQKLRSEYASEADYLKAVRFESASENQWAGVGFLCTMFFFFFYLYLQFLAATKRAPPIACLSYLLPPEPAPVSIDLVKQHGVLPLIDHYRGNFQSTGKLRVTAMETAMPYADEALGKSARLPKDLTTALKALFMEYAAKTKESSGLHADHMRELLSIIGLNFAPPVFKDMFKKVDTDNSETLDQMEFLNFFYDIITSQNPLPYQSSAEKASADTDGDGGDDEEDEMPEEFKDLPPDQQRQQIITASCKQMFIGTILVLIFSDPMVDVLAAIGKVSGIPPFYVSFVLAPLASNASELVASYKLAARKSSNSITQSLQTLEGAACMNNTFCLGIFFFLIFYQGLAWKFTAETASIFLVQFLVFLVVISKNTQSKSTGIMIFLCYPLSLIFVAVLEKGLGLD